MFDFFNKKNNSENGKNVFVPLASQLIHAARIDEDYSKKEEKIIKQTLIKLGADDKEVEQIVKEAENIEKNSNQILEYTKEAKSLPEEKKVLLLEALWSIIYSDDNLDMYESNLMRRLSGLLYLDKKLLVILRKIKIKKYDIYS